MLRKVLENNITIAHEVPSWKEAIRIAAKPLKDKGFITDGYMDSMIKNVVQNGPYIVIMPGVAIPHSRPEDGVLKTGMSLLKLSKGVKFPEDKEVQLVIVLASNDSDVHLELIAELTNLLIEDEAMEKLFSATSRQEVLECLP